MLFSLILHHSLATSIWMNRPGRSGIEMRIHSIQYTILYIDLCLCNFRPGWWMAFCWKYVSLSAFPPTIFFVRFNKTTKNFDQVISYILQSCLFCCLAVFFFRMHVCVCVCVFCFVCLVFCFCVRCWLIDSDCSPYIYKPQRSLDERLEMWTKSLKISNNFFFCCCTSNAYSSSAYLASWMESYNNDELGNRGLTTKDVCITYQRCGRWFNMNTEKCQVMFVIHSMRLAKKNSNNCCI